jgi:hypothetical protein
MCAYAMLGIYRYECHYVKMYLYVLVVVSECQYIWSAIREVLVDIYSF